ncbi:hypothetical protein CRYUN_Cryun23aG0098000 [Craigia yunnanensis]
MHSRAGGKRVQAALKRSISSLGDRAIESEDLHESFSGGSSNDEADFQNLELAIPEMNNRTISDNFQEALGTNSLSDEGAFIDEPSCITVKIVSRYLDAKLTVCCCSFVKTRGLKSERSFKLQDFPLYQNKNLKVKLYVCICRVFGSLIVPKYWKMKDEKEQLFSINEHAALLTLK